MGLATVAALTAGSLAIAPAPLKQASAQLQPAKATALTTAPDLISSRDLNNLARSCTPAASGQTTDYGQWREVSNCRLAARGARPDIPIDSMLFASDGEVKGFKRMIVSPERLAKLRVLYNASTSSTSTTCSRLGRNSLPIFVTVTKDLCDALSYDML